MSGPDTDTQWFIARDGKQHGPVSDVELRKLIELSHLKATDLVWRQGFSDWRAAASVFPAIAPAEPAPAAPVRTQSSSPAATATTGRPASDTAPTQTGPASPGLSSGPTLGGAPKPSSPQFGSAPQGMAPQGQGLQNPTTGRPGGTTPFGGGPSQPGIDPRLGPALAAGPKDVRPEPLSAHPLGGASRMGAGGFPNPSDNRLTTSGRRPSEMTVPVSNAPPPKSRRKLAVVGGLLLMAGVGAWIGSQHTDDILAMLKPNSSGEATPVVTNDEPSKEAVAAAVAPASTANATDEIDRSLQSRHVWVSVKQEFPDWYQTRVAEVARLSADNKDQTEITRYLVTELVKLRRENAKYALAASTTRHKALATAFLGNLQQLSRESGDGCYEFISKGEASTVIIARMQDPAKSAEIEAQILAIVAAIVEGRKEPSEHAAPIKTDYDLLAGELGRLGWTQADMQLFANPKALAQAPRDRVCNMLKDWFTAHLAIQDPSSQARLLFETLKPVVSG